jgi:hypothetical protein
VVSVLVNADASLRTFFGGHLTVAVDVVVVGDCDARNDWFSLDGLRVFGLGEKKIGRGLCNDDVERTETESDEEFDDDDFEVIGCPT